MNIEELKAALIHALNFGFADPLLDTIGRCLDSYENGGLRELEKALFRLKIDTRLMITDWQITQRQLQAYRAESAAQAQAEEARQAAEDQRLSGKFTNEEDDQEALEAYHHRSRQAA